MVGEVIAVADNPESQINKPKEIETRDLIQLDDTVYFLTYRHLNHYNSQLDSFLTIFKQIIIL
jgi:hypothetical protein